MSRTAGTAWIIAFLLAPATGQAATISVSGDDPRRAITVSIEDATVDAVLEQLHDRYGFEISGLQNVQKGDALSATMSGTLQSILERLLRNWNHVIVRSPDHPSGIAKVTIINAVYGAGSRRGLSTDGGDTPAERLHQAISGLD